MAPVEIDHVPVAAVKSFKVVDKAMSLPLVSSACSEVTRMTSPYVESTLSMVTPMMETTWSKVTPVVATVRSQVEEKVMPVIPSKVTETVQTVHNVAVSNISAAVEKRKIYDDKGEIGLRVQKSTDSGCCSRCCRCETYEGEEDESDFSESDEDDDDDVEEEEDDVEDEDDIEEEEEEDEEDEVPVQKQVSTKKGANAATRIEPMKEPLKNQALKRKNVEMKAPVMKMKKTKMGES